VNTVLVCPVDPVLLRARVERLLRELHPDLERIEFAGDSLGVHPALPVFRLPDGALVACWQVPVWLEMPDGLKTPAHLRVRASIFIPRCEIGNFCAGQGSALVLCQGGGGELWPRLSKTYSGSMAEPMTGRE